MNFTAINYNFYYVSASSYFANNYFYHEPRARDAKCQQKGGVSPGAGQRRRRSSELIN